MAIINVLLQVDQKDPLIGQTFSPGSLNMTKAETLQRCFIHPDTRRFHYYPQLTCSASSQHKYATPLIPKCGSTTLRHVLWDHFSAIETRCRGRKGGSSFQNPEYYRFSVARNPVPRFVSGFQEYFFRWWRNATTNAVPKEYANFTTLFQSPYTRSVSEFEIVFNGTWGQKKIDQAWNMFMEDYDGIMPFDEHLKLQAPLLKIAQHSAFDNIFDLTEIEMQIQKLAKRFNVPAISKQELHNKRPQKSTISELTRAHIQKICKMSAVDFCCLNYELPPECKGLVKCRWIENPSPSRNIDNPDTSQNMLLLEPVINGQSS